MKSRIYVCHTYYHVYISFLKEFALPEEETGKATLVLSTLTIPFDENFAERIRQSQMFEEVIFFDEKRDSFFPELDQYTNMQGNSIKIMLGRMKYTKLYARLEEPFIPVDFKKYKDIYVFCDSDPIGFYLNYKKIRYHAVEDGLNTLQYCDSARHRNQRYFRLKVFLSQLNLLFIQNGYGKYCIDMEVNDISCLKHPHKKYVEVSRKALADKMNQKQKQCLLKVFIQRYDELSDLMKQEKKILILTEPLTDMETRKKIFGDIIDRFQKEGKIIIKPHPNDWLDYEAVFGEYFIIKREVPMEMLDLIPDIHFSKVISVFTVLDNVNFADEKIRLGPDFMDKYEEPQLHRYL